LLLVLSRAPRNEQLPNLTLGAVGLALLGVACPHQIIALLQAVLQQSKDFAHYAPKAIAINCLSPSVTTSDNPKTRADTVG